MRRSQLPTLAKFGAFAVVMVILTGFLFAIFGQYRSGSVSGYSAVFSDVSALKVGDTVRVAGLRVGTVTDMSLRSDKKVVVSFDADREIALTTGTRAEVRYLNLVGDRYLELVNAPGSTRLLSAGSQIPQDRTSPALDLDLLLGGLKPVIRGLNPQDVNALTASLIEVFQGQGDTLQSLMSKTASFTNALADNKDVIQQLIVNLNSVLQTLKKDSGEFSGTLDRLEQLIAGLSNDRDPIGEAITALDHGTASIADLLGNARPPLNDTVNQLSRMAPLLDRGKDRIDGQLQLLPEDYRKLARIGSYGSFIPFYMCGLAFRFTDLQGRTTVWPWISQETGRCAEPDA
jgi:phospholipid/cholesterol/gamma-HCH transport system substrate-binding protein